MSRTHGIRATYNTGCRCIACRAVVAKYSALRRRGVALHERTTRQPVDRDICFHAKYIVDPGGCWIWQGGITDGGYGTFFDGHTRRAHRWAYQRFVGSVPVGLELDHLCRQKLCVNPSHLEPVTRMENMRRRYRKGAAKA